MAAIRLALFLLVVSSVWATPIEKQTKDKKYFSLEDLVPLNARFAQRGFGGTWISGTEFLFSKAGQPGLYVFEVTTQQERLFIDKAVFDLLNTTDVTVSPDKDYLLARSDPLTGFRYSSTARFALFERQTNKTYLIANHTRLQYCTFGGQGHTVGYVFENNVYYVNDTGGNVLQEVKLTSDGVPGVVYNGVPDWVYEEEVFGSGSAMWFSDDATRMAIASFNDTEVDTALYTIYGEPGTVDDQYTTIERLKYPKVGTKNPNVYLRVTNLRNSPSWLTLNPPAGLGASNDDVILGTVTWASENELAAVWLNRRQNRSIMVICNADTGSCANEITRSEPNGWIDVTTPIFNGNEFYDIDYVNQGSETWPHLLVYTRGNPTPRVLSSGARTVTNIVGWEKDLGKIYYLSTLENEPWQRHLFVAGTKNACISCQLDLTSGKPCRYASSSNSKGSKSFALSCQGMGPMNTILYRASDDQPVVMWRDNANLSVTLEEYHQPQQINMRVPVPGGFEAAVKLFLPPDLDHENGTNKQYPMIVNIYTGPNSARVTDVFSLGYQTYVSTNRSIIYAYVEGRGSGLKGKDMLFSVNNKLGTFEIEDVINVTRILANTYDWIDSKNIGLWGWSYGGYATSMALTKDTSRVFKCGIAVAPVTSWLYYDTIYTERYMGTPQENPGGYEESDVTKRARYLKDRNFLMLHGNADDNVHYQNAMALARELQTLDIQFEQMSYPDEAHSLSGVSRHVYHTIDHFWTRCFNSSEAVFI